MTFAARLRDLLTQRPLIALALQGGLFALLTLFL